MLDSRFAHHNTHLESPQEFEKLDPQLRRLSKQLLKYTSPLLDELPRSIPGIYSITGGRQIGKTTLLKQWMARLLKENVEPDRISFLTGELIDDHHSLVRLLEPAINQAEERIKFVIIDEITYIKDWDKGIKFLADAGELENVILMITGSDVTLIKEARVRLPGRRGVAAQVDFHMFPLSFRECARLKGEITSDELGLALESPEKLELQVIEKLFNALSGYLIHGGFLSAINEMAGNGIVSDATFSIYSDWIRGDVLKRGKQEHYLIDVLKGIIRVQGSQVTWNVLSKDLSIDHPKTVADYISLLSSMDVLFVQSAIIEDKLTEAPKKPRKIHFCDPFIRHSVTQWISGKTFEQIKTDIADNEISSHLIESVAANHVHRAHPTFYIKAEGEVDIAYISEDRFWPVEVKWTRQKRTKDLKQVAKYKNAVIWNKSPTFTQINGLETVPLPVALLRY